MVHVSKTKLVYDHIQCVLTQTDEEAFKKLLLAFVKYLKYKPFMNQFAQYFENTVIPKCGLTVIMCGAA